MELENINEAWDNFVNVDDVTENDNIFSKDSDSLNKEFEYDTVSTDINSELNKSKVPKCSELHISTKTKIAHLNQTINLDEIFWKIRVNEYFNPVCGIIKKQMKINSATQEELDKILLKLKIEKRFINQNIISHIENPDGRVKFRDIRKINIGIAKKDIESYRCKVKSAFYNCFVLIIRILHEDKFKELHVKVFNTGQLEIPGIQSDEMFENVMSVLLTNLQPLVPNIIDYNKDKTETILYNSNFNCGYFINRDKFFNLLKYKYKIQAIYDPCSYPGIQCKFYYNKLKITEDMDGVKMDDTNDKISFMIFRTGSTLIVGKCDKKVLISVYDFLKNVMKNEYSSIVQIMENEEKKKKDKKRKIKKKILVNN